MTRFLRYLVALMFVFVMFEAKANHILGGNISWQCMGGNQYAITLTLYKDCFGASAALGTENVFFFPTGCGGFPFNASLILQSATEISDLCPNELANSSCVGGIAPGTFKLVYNKIVTLDPNCTWKAIYNDGDWNYFNNIDYSTLPDAYICSTINTTTCSSSVSYTNLQVPYKCRNSGSYTITPTFTVPAGVTASYSIVTPQTTGASINSSINVPGYVNTLGATINATTGAVTINSNGVNVGNYVITVQITLTQGGNTIGVLNENMAVVMRDCTTTPTTFNNPHIQTIDDLTQFVNANTISVCAGDSVCFTVAASNTNVQRAVTITATWPASLNGGNPVFTPSTLSSNPASGELCFLAAPSTIGTGQ